MATRKKAVEPRANVAPGLLSVESNKQVARAKAALAKKWSATRPQCLAELVHIAWYLVALGRDEEARALVDHVAEGADPTGGTELWSAAAGAIALGARLCRLAKDEGRRASLMARLVAYPTFPIASRPALLAALAEADKDIRSAEVDPSQKFACEGFARGCARATYVHEMLAEGVSEAGASDALALTRTIEDGLAGLRAHLAR